MRKKDREMLEAINTRRVTQGQIMERFGEEAIQKAKERLCSKCKFARCALLPITTKGEDCPYFQLREDLK